MVGVGAALLAACSSNSSSSPAGGSTTTTVPSSTSGPTSTSTSSSRSTTAATTTCPTATLTGSVVGSSGAAGTIETTVALKTTSAIPCTLAGYPGLQMLAAGGSSLPTTVVRKGTDSFTSMAPTTVTLTDGQSATFNIGYSDVPSGSAACPRSTSLEITPPNAFDHLVVPAALAPCGGTLVVSPVFLPTGSNSQTTAPPAAG